MSDEKQAKKCVKFFKIGRHLGNLEGLRKRHFLQKVHRKNIVNCLSNYNTKVMDDIYKLECEMENSNSADLDKIEDKMMYLYEQLLCDTLDMTDQLLEKETK